MARDHIAKLWVLAGIVLCAAILPPIFFGEPRVVDGQSGGDSWRNILYDFQTLFTGILALGAAALTIVQSRIVDERQQDRHNDLLELQMRPDKLRMERANVAFDELTKGYMKLSGCKLPFVSHEGEPFTDDETRSLELTRKATFQMGAVLGGEELNKIRDLCDAALHRDYEKLRWDVSTLSDLLTLVATPDGHRVDAELWPDLKRDAPMTPEIRRAAVFFSEQQQAEVLRGFESFAGSFIKLLRLYKII